jgi:hypothetical protein
VVRNIRALFTEMKYTKLKTTSVQIQMKRAVKYHRLSCKNVFRKGGFIFNFEEIPSNAKLH